MTNSSGEQDQNLKSYIQDLKKAAGGNKKIRGNASQSRGVASNGGGQQLATSTTSNHPNVNVARATQLNSKCNLDHLIKFDILVNSQAGFNHPQTTKNISSNMIGNNFVSAGSD